MAKYTRHYTGGIEPEVIINANGYNFEQGNILKYLHRVGKKAGEEKKDIIKIVDYGLLLAYSKDIELDDAEVLEHVTERLKWLKENKEIKSYGKL